MTEALQSWVDRWAQVWSVPELGQAVRVEFSSRMRRSLGRCYAPDGLIRLNRRLLDGPEEFLREVLCHEAAHVAVYLLHGNSRRPHGRDWAELMTLAGYEPRVRVPMELLPASVLAGAAPKRLYEHSCPVCGARRVARRAVRRWRCRACREAGLDGRLEIVRRAVQ